MVLRVYGNRYVLLGPHGSPDFAALVLARRVIAHDSCNLCVKVVRF